MPSATMPFPHPSLQAFEPHLASYCAATSPLLTHISSVFHTCIPTPLALISTVLGCLSILSWLFAQLPQIIKNHRLKSTSGLSIYFLVEWCLGDMSNLFGAILTHQASWQVIIGAYYCCVDLALVAQWTWFEGLGRGAKVIAVWRRVSRQDKTPHPDGLGKGRDMREVIESVDPATGVREFQQRHAPQDIPKAKDNIFRTPNYGTRLSANDEFSLSSYHHRSVHRVGNSPLPSPSPRTMLLTSLVLCLASTTVSASPLSQAPLHEQTTPGLSLGTILSWCSTVLYLLSRLPQLLKNHRLRSTAGLSPLLFAAAFHGNLFYSTSLLLNPNLWYDVVPCSPTAVSSNTCRDPQHGWTGPAGNSRREWTLAALPFFLGAAGVLVMDAGIGVQFLLWGESARKKDAIQGGEPETERVLVVEASKDESGKRRWKEVNGWMRGWVPSVNGGVADSFGGVGSLRATGSWGGIMRRGRSLRGAVPERADTQVDGERTALLRGDVRGGGGAGD